jgi:hypothetical protein
VRIFQAAGAQLVAVAAQSIVAKPLIDRVMQDEEPDQADVETAACTASGKAAAAPPISLMNLASSHLTPPRTVLCNV